MRRATVCVQRKRAGISTEIFANDNSFEYDENYEDEVVSLTMPTSHKKYVYKSFPPFFDGLLSEGVVVRAIITYWEN